MSKQPKLTKAYDGRGSDMGRRTVLPDNPAQPIRLHLARMRMTADGCYDAGGAYWGCGSATSGGMWLAWGLGPQTVEAFTDKAPANPFIHIRAVDRAAAKMKVLAMVPGATFYK